MSTSQNWTIYQISSVSYFDQTIILDTRRLPSLTDAEVFSIASAIVTALSGTLGTDVYVMKDDWTDAYYTADYVNKTFS